MDREPNEKRTSNESHKERSLGLLVKIHPGYGNTVPGTYRRVATRTQKRSCVHIENFDKNENMVNLGHKVRIKLNQIQTNTNMLIIT